MNSSHMTHTKAAWSCSPESVSFSARAVLDKHFTAFFSVVVVSILSTIFGIGGGVDWPVEWSVWESWILWCFESFVGGLEDGVD